MIPGESGSYGTRVPVVQSHGVRHDSLPRGSGDRRIYLNMIRKRGDCLCHS
jgi:hypothetical protein